jgi:hypothetical protein
MMACASAGWRAISSSVIWSNDMSLMSPKLPAARRPIFHPGA